VVGIDKNPEFIERARRRDPDGDYRVMDWADIGSIKQTFDVVLLLSALHYARDPQLLLHQLMTILHPEGLLVLECGIAPGMKPEWVSVPRPVGDVVLHPTHSALIKALAQAAVRQVGPSVSQAGDQVDRYVYHVRPLKPIVLLVSGAPGTGKSTLLSALTSGGGVIPVNLDHLLLTMPSWCRDDSLLAIRESRPFESEQIGELIDLMVREGAEEAFAAEVLERGQIKLVNRNRAVTVVEGYALSQGGFGTAFATRLRDRGCYVWRVEPDATSPATAVTSP
jgi:SAM-dependent methyltransferase